MLTMIASFAVIFPEFSEAKSIRTEVLLVIPKDEIKAQAKDRSGQLTFHKDVIALGGEFPVQLKSLDLNFEYSVELLNLLGGGAFETTVKMPTAKIRIGELHIDTVIELESNGVRVRVPIKANCTNLEVKSVEPLQFSIKGQVQEAPVLGLGISEVQWPKTRGGWIVNAESCEAAPGFTTFLGEQIGKQWSENAELPNLLREELNKEISPWFAKGLTMQHQLPALETVLTMHGTKFYDINNAWIFGLETTIDPHALKGSICPILENETYIPAISQNVQVSKPELWISEKVIEVWSQCLHQRSVFQRQDAGQSISGFRSLMNSRFLQWFVWGDLLRFEKNTDFRFSTSSYGAFQLTPMNTSFTANTAGAHYNLTTQVASHMSYVEGGRNNPYMTFFSPLQSALSMNVADSQLSIQMTSAPKTKLAYRFDIPRNQIRTLGVGVSKLEGAVKSFLTKEAYMVTLPKIEVMSGMKFEASGLRRSNQTLKIELRQAK